MSNVIMPRELTAENGAKSLLAGEFKELIVLSCQECQGEGLTHYEGEPELCEYCDGAGDYSQAVGVSWTTIKEIYAMAAKHLGKELDN